MNFLEKDLEEIIYTADKKFLSNRGLESVSIGGKMFRQTRIGNYGIVDLLQFNRPFYHPAINNIVKGEITVYELKQNNLSVSAFLQAARYLHGIKRYLKKRGLDEYFNFRIILIGKKIDCSSSFAYLPELLSCCDNIEIAPYQSFFSFEMYKYEYMFDGIRFKRVGDYKLINEGF